MSVRCQGDDAILWWQAQLPWSAVAEDRQALPQEKHWPPADKYCRQPQHRVLARTYS